MRAFVLMGALLLTASYAAAASLDGDFRQYPVDEVYRAKVHLPQFSGRDKSYRQFRTRIVEGMSGGANFAGKYAIIEVGCGAGCLSPFMADVSTGAVLPFPLGGEDNMTMTLKYRVESRLLIAQYESHDSCVREKLVWTGSKFQRSTPERVGAQEACYNSIE